MRKTCTFQGSRPTKLVPRGANRAKVEKEKGKGKAREVESEDEVEVVEPRVTRSRAAKESSQSREVKERVLKESKSASRLGTAISDRQRAVRMAKSINDLAQPMGFKFGDQLVPNIEELYGSFTADDRASHAKALLTSVRALRFCQNLAYDMTEQMMLKEVMEADKGLEWVMEQRQLQLEIEGVYDAERMAAMKEEKRQLLRENRERVMREKDQRIPSPERTGTPEMTGIRTGVDSVHEEPLGGGSKRGGSIASNREGSAVRSVKELVSQEFEQGSSSKRPRASSSPVGVKTRKKVKSARTVVDPDEEDDADGEKDGDYVPGEGK